MTKDKVQRKKSVPEYWHFMSLTCRVVRSHCTPTQFTSQINLILYAITCSTVYTGNLVTVSWYFCHYQGI